MTDKSPNVEWIKRRKELLKIMEQFNIKGDRLTKTTQLTYMHNALHESVIGFSGWLNSWISLELTKKINASDDSVPTLSDKELDDFHEKFKEITMKFIELDIDITENISKKLKKKFKGDFERNGKEDFGRMVV